MAGQGIKVGPLIAAGGGVILLWSAITGRKWSSVFKDVIKGQNPTGVKPTNLITSAPDIGGGVAGLTTGPLPGATAPSGSVLSGTALRALWISAGGNPFKADIAVCIAQHESGGRVTVTSSNPDGGTNVGLWQLDTPGGKGAGYSISQLQNPLTNAIVAIRGSSDGTDWSAWATAPMCGV